MWYTVGVMSGSLGERIKELRSQNKSYKQIVSALGISKGTVSYWLAGDSESQKIKKQLTLENLRTSKLRIQKIIDTNRKKWAALWSEAESSAKEEFEKLVKNPLFVAGISIYWGEGDSKIDNPVRISNTDPRMIAVYCEFLRTILKISEEKIKVGLILYPDLNDKICTSFWSKVTKVIDGHFFKSQYIRGSHPTKRLAHGICMVIVSNKYQKVKILKWIDLFAKKFTIVQ